MKKPYILLQYLSSGTMAGYMLYDLHRSEQVTLMTGQPEGYSKRSLPGKLFYRLLWELKLWLLPLRAKKRSWVLIPNETMLCLSKGTVRYWKRLGLRLCAILIDPIDAPYPTAVKAKQLLGQVPFHKVLTFDPQNAQTYGWQYVNTLYSQFPAEPPEKTSDLFYIGAMKDRLPVCLDLLEQAQSHCAAFSLRLLGVPPEKQQLLPAEALLHEAVPYPQTLSWVLGTNCILDMTQPGQAGITLRYYEAVVYGKKLLTNNAHIKNLPFYDPNTMRIYRDLSDLDWAWICSKASPAQPYNGLFSPLHLLSLLED